jgi:hypothetical protein
MCIWYKMFRFSLKLLLKTIFAPISIQLLSRCTQTRIKVLTYYPSFLVDYNQKKVEKVY